ncbi:MFS transporter [Paenibacillus chartarius]|uniref:MFS transporter n=1 Tax=Paenibacillus chartarius TaxID=747481 RepID=A0ABV6DR10_9BACL
MIAKTNTADNPVLIRLLMITMMLSSMSAMMFTIVLPRISQEFGLTMAEVSWLTSAYTLIYAIGTVTYGKLADRYALKHLLTFGLLVFAAGSLFGLVSQSYGAALAARCLQAAGAAAVPATATLIPVRYVAPERRGAALGTLMSGLALGSVLGPIVTSLIVSVAHWRWLFVIPLLLLLTLPYYYRYLGNDKGEAKPFDWIGGGLLGGAVTLLLLGITNGSWGAAFGFAVVLFIFVLRIRSVKEPFVKPELFRNRHYTMGVAQAACIIAIGTSFFYLTPILLSEVQKLPPYWIGFVMMPAAAASALLGRRGGKLADRKGNPALFYTASGLLLACFLLMSTFTAAAPVWLAAILILGNVGQSFMQIAMSNSVSQVLPKEQSGVGMGLFGMLNFLSMGIATGVYGKLVDIGAAAPWNPVNGQASGAIFSNVYLILAALHAGILLWFWKSKSAAGGPAAVSPQPAVKRADG